MINFVVECYMHVCLAQRPRPQKVLTLFSFSREGAPVMCWQALTEGDEPEVQQ